MGKTNITKETVPLNLNVTVFPLQLALSPETSHRRRNFTWHVVFWVMGVSAATHVCSHVDLWVTTRVDPTLDSERHSGKQVEVKEVIWGWVAALKKETSLDLKKRWWYDVSGMHPSLMTCLLPEMHKSENIFNGSSAYQSDTWARQPRAHPDVLLRHGILRQMHLQPDISVLSPLKGVQGQMFPMSYIQF